MRALVWAGLAVAVLVAGCTRDPAAPATPNPAAGRTPIVTISADQAVSPVPAWRPPAIAVDEANAKALKTRADAALAAGELYADAASAIPLYYALMAYAPNDAKVAAGLERALAMLIVQGDQALAEIDDDPLRLRGAHEAAAVARAVAPGNKKVAAYLQRVDRADQAQEANRLGEGELNAGRIGEDGKGGALAYFREALELRAGDVRASQGVAAAESALIRRAEIAADRDDYAGAERWLALAAQVRPKMTTAADARGRIATQRAARVGRL
ncbi:MAG: formylglycine-generating enzyme family protein, partial [Lysobacter sp.]|nr:formylglycine-generating enzyme family protein [Lysobacter sp.]